MYPNNLVFLRYGDLNMYLSDHYERSRFEKNAFINVVCVFA